MRLESGPFRVLLSVRSVRHRIRNMIQGTGGQCDNEDAPIVQ